MNPTKALNTIVIPANKIYTTLMDAKVIDGMKQMNRNVYTHVPIVEDGKLIGVFSENTVFSYLTKNEEAIFDKNLLIYE